MGKTIRHHGGKTAFSFFSGAGLLDLGFESEGFNIAFVNDISNRCIEANRHSRRIMGFPGPQMGYHNCDIREFLSNGKKEWLSQATKKKMKEGPTGFIGGPPCPDFSIAGKNKGRKGRYGVLSEIFFKAISAHRPDFFVFENVKGLWGTLKHREFYTEMVSLVSREGYLVTDRIANAIEYGVPQDRYRVILIGFEEGYLKESAIGFISRGKRIEGFPWEAPMRFSTGIMSSPAWPSRNNFSPGKEMMMPPGVEKEITIQHWFDKNDVGSHPNSNDFFTPRKGIKRMMTVDEGDVSRKSYKRPHRWRYSPTACYGNNEVHLHPYLPRRMSVSEALAIQSMPKEYEMPLGEIPLTDKFRMIGNGVPFLMAKGIAKSVSLFIEGRMGENGEAGRKA